jgi:hypothetical protein
MWPQWTMLFLLVFGLGISAAEHGKPRTNHNFWVQFMTTSLTIGLLYLGGFFKGMF